MSFKIQLKKIHMRVFSLQLNKRKVYIFLYIIRSWWDLNPQVLGDKRLSYPPLDFGSRGLKTYEIKKLLNFMAENKSLFIFMLRNNQVMRHELTCYFIFTNLYILSALARKVKTITFLHRNQIVVGFLVSSG